MNDPVKVGYVTEPAPGTTGGFWFDTSLPGNANTGHEFSASFKPHDYSNPASAFQNGVIGPALSEQDRMDLVEYLKVHRDPPSPPDYAPADCYAPAK